MTEGRGERGRLIALEHKLATQPLQIEERAALQRQIRAFEVYEPQWLAGWVPPERTELVWHHGFVVGVALPGDGALDLLEELVALPFAVFLTSLSLRNNGGEELALALAGSRALRGLTSLDLEGNGIGDEGAAALAVSETLRSLSTLDLGYNKIGPEGARALATPQTLRSLTGLRLSGNEVGPEGARALAASQTLRSLVMLDLGVNDISGEGEAALAASEILQGCEVETQP